MPASTATPSREKYRSPRTVSSTARARISRDASTPRTSRWNFSAAAALRARSEEAETLAVTHHDLIERIRAQVPLLVPDVEVVGHPTERLPHLVTFSCLYVDGEALLTELDREGFAVSSGSSCTASTLRPSHVLAAMGVLTHGNVRVSLTRTTSSEEVDRFLDVLPRVVERVRATAGVDRL